MNNADTQQPQGSGLPYAFSAYLIWGFLPVYFKLLTGIAAFEILAHRIVWSVPIVFAILYFRRQWGEFVAALGNPAVRRLLLVSSVLIAVNWLVYMWAITADKVLATSIGYYLNPLVNVLLGRLFLGERQAHPPLGAGASVERGVEVIARKRHTNWAAPSGWMERLVLSLLDSSDNVAYGKILLENVDHPQEHPLHL